MLFWLQEIYYWVPSTQNVRVEVISKIVDYVQGRDANRFKNGAYTLVFEAFESVCNKAFGP